MRISTILDGDMKIAERVECEGSQEFFDESEIELIADVGNSFRPTILKKRAPTQIQCNPNEGFIHGEEPGSVAEDSTFFPQGIGKGASESDSGILNRVVEVNFDISFRFDFEIESTVLGEEIQHVVEERNACVDLRLAGTIEVESKGNIGLTRFPGDLAAAGSRFFHETRFASDRRSVNVYLFGVVLNLKFLPARMSPSLNEV